MLNIKPVVILSRGSGVFIDGDGRMEMVPDGAETKVRFNTLLQELKSELEDRATILEALVVSAPDECASLVRSDRKSVV